MMKSRFLIPLMLVVLAASTASADQTSIVDPPDSDQRMDPVEAAHGHAQDLRGVLAHTVTAADPWADGDVGKLVLRIWLPNKSQRWDRQIVVTTNAFDDETRSSWEALVYDKRGRIRGHANAWRPDDRSFRIEFSRALLGHRFDSYRWVVRAVVMCRPEQEGDLCGGPRVDRVPDAGKISHKL